MYALRGRGTQSRATLANDKEGDEKRGEQGGNWLMSFVMHNSLYYQKVTLVGADKKKRKHKNRELVFSVGVQHLFQSPLPLCGMLSSVVNRTLIL